ncbi:hypothetical protein ACIO1C_33075 [Streptomyces sp. NPDC087420]|uniref:hypothetical protein n=1 Tax=Streptomyces sp. NPDC087420 TaxID=3365785 RepID=UPI0038392494
MTALKDMAAAAVGRGRGRKRVLEALDTALNREFLFGPETGDLCEELSKDHGALVAWLSRLVERDDLAALHLLHTGEDSAFHDGLARKADFAHGHATTERSELRLDPSLTEDLRRASGLAVFDPARTQILLDPARVQAALALDLVDPQLDEGRLAAALSWYRNAGSTPDLPAGSWTPAGLSHGDERLRRALERLVAAAGDTAGTGPVLAVAMALCRLALGRLPGRPRPPVAVRVLFDYRGVGAAARLTLILLPGGPRGLVPDPGTMPLFTTDGTFTAAMARAWNAAGQKVSGTVLWSVQGFELADRGGLAGHPSLFRITGPSLGAAFGVLLAETARVRQPALRLGEPGRWAAALGRRYLLVTRVQPKNSVTADVTDEGELVSVAGFRAKLAAAHGLGVVVVAEVDGREARGAADELRTGRPQIAAVPDVAKAARKARSLSRRHIGIYVLSVLTPLVIFFGAAAWVQAGNAEEEKRQKQARTLLNDATGVQDSDPALALRLALSAHRMSPNEASRNSLVRILLETRYRGEVPAVPGTPGPTAVAWTNGGRTLLTRDGDRITVRDAAKRTTVASLPVPAGGKGREPQRRLPPVLLPMNPAGGAVLIGTADHRAELWGFEDPAHPRKLAALPGDGQVLQAAVGGDSRTLATLGPLGPPGSGGSASPEALTVYDVGNPGEPRATGQLAAYPATSDTHVVDLSVNRSGNRVAVTDGRRTRLHDTRAAGLPAVVTINPSGQLNPTSDVAFDTRLDSALYTATTRPNVMAAGNQFIDVWSIGPEQGGDGYRKEASLRGASQVVTGPRGGAVALDDTGAILLGSQTILRTTTGTAQSGDAEHGARLAFTPDGNRLAAPAANGTLRLWYVGDHADADSADPLQSYESAAFAARASVLAVSQRIAGTTRGELETVLLDTASGPPFKRLTTFPDPADLLGIDRDATRLAVLRAGELTLWDIKDRAHPRRLKAEFPLPQDISVGAGGPSGDGSGHATGGLTSLLVGLKGTTVVAVRAGSAEALVWRVDGDGDHAAPAQRLTGGTPAPTEAPTEASPPDGGMDDIPGDGEEPAASVSGGWTPGAIPGDGAWPEEYEDAEPESAPRTLPDAAFTSGSDAQGDAALSPDGRTLVVDAGGTELAVWDVSGPVEARVTQTIGAPAERGPLLFSEDGGILRAGRLGWRLTGSGKAEAVADLPLPQGAGDIKVLAEGPWGALAVTSGPKTFTTWYVRAEMEPVALGTDAFGEVPRAFALPPGRLLLGYSGFVVRDVREAVTTAADPETAACAVTGGGLTRAELRARAPGATWHPACPE